MSRYGTIYPGTERGTERNGTERNGMKGGMERHGTKSVKIPMRTLYNKIIGKMKRLKMLDYYDYKTYVRIKLLIKTHFLKNLCVLL